MFSSFRRRLNAVAGLRRHRGLEGIFFSSSSTSATTKSASAAAGELPPSSPNFMVEYLVKSCGFSAAEASKASKQLAHLKSTAKCDSVLTFLRSQGFGDAALRRIVYLNPKWLCCDVEKNFAPKFQSLRDLGFSELEMVELVVSNPSILSRSLQSVIQKLNLWQHLFGSKEVLLKFCKRKLWFLSHSLESKILPNMSSLQECGIAEERISLVVKRHPSFILQKPEALRALVSRAEELGISRQSKMFLWCLLALFQVKETTFKSKFKLMKSLGWSEAEVLAAFRQAPNCICLSEKELGRKMDFLVREVGYLPSYIAHNPTLLFYSLEKRMIPRYRLMEMLKSNGLLSKYKFHSILRLTAKTFLKKFVLRYKEQVPELHSIFVTI